MLIKYFTHIIFILAVLIIISGCKGIIVDPPGNKEAAIYGTVVDQYDNPLSNVNVHYFFYLGDNVELRDASISYSLQSSQNILLQIYDMNNNIISKLVDGQQNAGRYTIFFNGDSLTNGIYHYKVTGQSLVDEGSFPLLTYDAGKLISTLPLIRSDYKGEFIIKYAELGIGTKYLIQSIQKELVVADSIKFVLHKEGYRDLIAPANLDTNKVFEKTFKMEESN